MTPPLKHTKTPACCVSQHLLLVKLSKYYKPHSEWFLSSCKKDSSSSEQLNNIFLSACQISFFPPAEKC